MKKPNLLLLFVVAILIAGCAKEESQLFDALVETQDGWTYLGLKPGISSKEEVSATMRGFEMFDHERESNPIITEYSSDKVLYFERHSYFFLPSSNYSVDFFFSADNELTEICIRTVNLPIEDFFAVYGEPDSVIFSIHATNRLICDLRLYYDDLQALVWVNTSGNASRETCRVSERNELSGLSLLSEDEYPNHAVEYLSSWYIEGNPDRYIHTWNGFGKLANLYPEYPILLAGNRK